MAGQGIQAEIVDLRTLRPLDMDTILASVRKTHRAVIVDEGWRTGSLAGEINWTGRFLRQEDAWDFDRGVILKDEPRVVFDVRDRFAREGIPN